MPEDFQDQEDSQTPRSNYAQVQIGEVNSLPTVCKQIFGNNFESK